jgi:dTDP-4-amino-4,6-dideoxygalactose transaminase
MIEFLPRKNIDKKRIGNLLSISQSKNHFANTGPVKKMLEERLCKELELSEDKRVVCCSSGTAALHSLMYFCNEQFGTKRWAVPSFTFPSPVVGNPFDVCIFDIDPETYTIPMGGDRLDNYDGIILTNLFGTIIKNIDEWEKYASSKNKILIFDNAASPLSIHDGKNISKFGDYSFGSLHHTKYLGFGEGGFAVIPTDQYDIINSLNNFGFYWLREYKENSSNFKMSDVAAAYILSHIESFDRSRHIAKQTMFLMMLEQLNGAKPFNLYTDSDFAVYNTMPVVFDKPANEHYFKNRNIMAHKYYKPLYDSPNAKNLYDHIINFPLYSELTESDLNQIVDQIDLFIRKS